MVNKNLYNIRILLRKIPFSIKLFIILDLLLSAIYCLFKFNPVITEKVYSLTIYPVIAFLLGRLTDILSIPVTEWILLLLLMILLIRISIALFHIVKKKLRFRDALKHFLRQAFIFISVIVITSYSIMLFNYFRLPFESGTQKNIVITDDYFTKVLNYLIKKTNEFYTKPTISMDEVNGKINNDISLFMKKIHKKDIMPARKFKSFMIDILATTNTGACTMPLQECYISSDLCDFKVPNILAHEKAHLYGYLNEAEANLIAFMVCINSDDRFIRYSGYLNVLGYFMSSYYRNHSKEEYDLLYNTIRSEIKEDWEKENRIYMKHNSQLTRFCWDIYDLLLKANNIKGGKASYSLVVELVLKSRIINFINRL